MEEKQAKIDRPKAGSYPTFSSQRGATTFPFRKPVYEKGVLLSEKVTVTVQRGVEFDVYKECFGDGKAFAGNPYFLKFIKDGVLTNGKRVPLNPAELQTFLEAKLKSDTNRLIEWKDRPRSAKEKELEAAIASRDSVIEASNADNAKLRALLEKNNIKVD